MTKLVIFDLDGTLYFSESSYYPAILKLLRNHNVAAPDENFLNSLIGEPMTVFKTWFDSFNLEKSADDLLEEFDDLEIASIHKEGVLYPKVAETIKTMRDNEIIMGICSNGGSRYVNAVLDALNLSEYMSFVRVPGKEGKSKSLLVNEICNEFEYDDGFFLGDRYHDVTAAKDNNLTSLGASWGYGGDEMESADIILKTFDELINII